MPRTHKLATDLHLSFAGYEASFPRLVVEYTHHRAYDGRRVEPSEPEHVEIGRVYVVSGEIVRGEWVTHTKNPLPEWMIEGMQADLEAACLEDWRAEDACDRESAAEMRREMSRPLDFHKAAAE